MIRSADVAYFTDTGLTLCASCAELARQQRLKTGMAKIENEVITPSNPEDDEYHQVVGQEPVQEPTPCDHCLAFLSPR